MTFLRPVDSVLYLDRLDVLARRYKVRIHALCLMSNHIHFMLEPLRKGAISRLMQHLQSQHARYMNGLAHTAGHMWHHHFHAKHIKSSAQYRETLLYIERNPVAANLHKQAHLYPFSSAAAHQTNQPVLTVQHKRHRAQVKLYLDRWRKEFEIPDPGATNWAAWLSNGRLPTKAADMAPFLGRVVHRPVAMAPASASGAALATHYAVARGS